ncbi:MAG: CoA ester lyase [Rhizobiaceae bacterium]|nr:CoA ester lyase [Rhizobiaceae bacterium]
MKDFRAYRSWLFVPGDSERKLAKAWSSGADVIIVDLEDAVSAENKRQARLTATTAIGDARAAGIATTVVVRINGLETGLAEEDIQAVARLAVDGIVLPKVRGAADVAEAARRLDAAEPSGAAHLAIIPIATEVPAAIFALPEIASAHRRVRGIFWGMEDLGAEIGARRTRRDDGEILEAFRTVRSLALFAASAAGIASVDTPFVDIANAAGLEHEATEASWMGFSGKLAIHPAQVEAINVAFSPTADEIAEAETILCLSRDGGGAAFRYKGRMIDTPHLVAAERLLARTMR